MTNHMDDIITLEINKANTSDVAQRHTVSKKSSFVRKISQLHENTRC